MSLYALTRRLTFVALLVCCCMSPMASAGEPEFLGKPLSHWTTQAEAAENRVIAQTVDALMLAFQSGDLAVIVAAADALEMLGPRAEKAAPLLAAALAYKQPWVRTSAMNALKAIGAPAAPFVLDVFQNGAPAARPRAALVLGSMGPAAKIALPVLKAARDKTPPDGRAQLNEVLGLIDPSLAAPAVQQARPTGVAKFDAQPSAAETAAPDAAWPEFHGPRRDNLCRESGLLAAWPAAGPKLLWKLTGVGRGYSTVSIAAGRLFTMGDRRDGKTERQYAAAYDLATRKPLWAAPIGPPHDDGPRATPTVDGSLVYVLSTEGGLFCLEAATGKNRWQKDLVKEFGAVMMSGWKFSESPLIDGDKLICTPGSADATIVALNKRNGNLIWKTKLPELGPSGKDGAAYSSPIAAEIAGRRQYLQVLGRGLVGVDAASGQLLWSYNRLASRVANIPHPLVRGDYVFTSNGYQTGSALLRIVRRGEAFQAEEVYFLDAKTFSNHHGGFVRVGDYIYGGSGQNKGDPVCIEMASGKVAWRAPAPARGSAAVLYADGRILFRYDRGQITLVEATPQAYRVAGSFKPLLGEGPAWAHPVIFQGKLYLRHNDLLLCYDLRAGSGL